MQSYTDEKWNLIVEEFRKCAVEFKNLSYIPEDSGLTYQLVKQVFATGYKPNFFNQVKVESWVNKKRLEKENSFTPPTYSNNLILNTKEENK